MPARVTMQERGPTEAGPLLSGAILLAFAGLPCGSGRQGAAESPADLRENPCSGPHSITGRQTDLSPAAISGVVDDRFAAVAGGDIERKAGLRHAEERVAYALGLVSGLVHTPHRDQVLGGPEATAEAP